MEISYLENLQKTVIITIMNLNLKRYILEFILQHILLFTRSTNGYYPSIPGYSTYNNASNNNKTNMNKKL